MPYKEPALSIGKGSKDTDAQVPVEPAALTAVAGYHKLGKPADDGPAGCGLKLVFFSEQTNKPLIPIDILYRTN